MTVERIKQGGRILTCTDQTGETTVVFLSQQDATKLAGWLGSAWGTLTIPKNGPPTTPGEFLLKDYLEPLGMTPHAFAARLGMSAGQLRGLLRGTRAVTAEIALLLGRALKTSPEFWMNAQAATDLCKARQKLAATVLKA